MKVTQGLSKFVLVFSGICNALFAVNLCGPDLVGNGDDVVVVWSGFNGSYFVVQQAQYSAGGSWGSPQTISGAAHNCYYPAAAINNQGDLLYAWQQQRTSGEVPRLQLALSSFGSDTAPAVITPSFYGDPALSGLAPHGFLDNGGVGTVFFEGALSGKYAIFAVPCSSADLRTPIVTVLPQSSSMHKFHAALDSAGTLWAVWQEPSDQMTLIMGGSAALNGARKGPVSLAPTQSGSDPVIAINSAGNCFAAWVSATSPNTSILVTSLGTDFATAPDTLSLTGYNLTEPHIGVNASGTILIVAKATDATGSGSIAAIVKTGGTWGSWTTLSGSAAKVSNPSAALNDAGQGVAMWIDKTSGIGIVQAALYSSGWGAASTLSTSSSNSGSISMYLSPSGLVVASWMTVNDTNAIAIDIEASILPSFSGSWGSPTQVSSF